MWVVVHHLHFAHAQGIVYVGNILLDALSSLLQHSHAVSLPVVRLHHFRDVTSCHIDTFQFSFLVADRVDGRLIVHLTLKSEVFWAYLFFLEAAGVDHAACVHIVNLLYWNLTEERIVLQVVLSIE